MAYCPNCKNKQQSDLRKYGFTLLNGDYYWTIIKEVKACCPVKVQLIDHNLSTVTVEFDGKKYIKTRKDFMESSWRNIDSY